MSIVRRLGRFGLAWRASNVRRLGLTTALATALATVLATPLATVVATPLATVVATVLATPLATGLATPLATALATPLARCFATRLGTGFRNSAPLSLFRNPVGDRVPEQCAPLPPFRDLVAEFAQRLKQNPEGVSNRT